MDNIIITKAINGDKDAFITIMKSVEAKMYIVAKSRLDNNEDIKDVIQETIFESYKNIRQLRDIEKFESWVLSILINNCNKFYKNHNNYNYISYSENEPDTNNQFTNLEKNLDFLSLLKLLDKSEQEIFTLFYINEYTTPKISELLNINENTVKTKLRRARQKIKEYIERWDDYET